ncbi:MAG TPA: Fe-S protein assembly co-chaperone HscB [Terriglobales bacterium]|jgi:molecular chaperone HscB
MAKPVIKTSSSLVMPEAAHSEATAACWSCGEMRAAHFCSACGKVQPPAPVDFFSFFGLPRKLNVDVARLEKEFYALSRKLHPDLYSNSDGREQTWSLEKSSQLNDAYRALKDPIKRTEYLLKLEGVELEEQSKAATEKARATGEVKKQVVPPGLLEEVFELNMQLEEARMNKKMGEDDPALLKDLEAQKVTLEQKHEALFDELKTYWSEWDQLVDGGTEEDRRTTRDKMVDVLNRRNYIRNLVRDVNEALEN